MNGWLIIIIAIVLTIWTMKRKWLYDPKFPPDYDEGDQREKRE